MLWESRNRHLCLPNTTSVIYPGASHTRSNDRQLRTNCEVPQQRAIKAMKLKHVCTCVCCGIHAHGCATAHKGHRMMSGVLLYDFPPYSFEAEALTGPRVRLAGRKLQQSYCLCPCSARVMGTSMTTPSLFMWVLEI